MEIRIEHLVKSYGGVRALDDVSLTVADGELFFLLGPSGCGKTTLLRSIGGFEKPDSGEMFIGGDPVASRPASERNTAMVFQGYALWPHMTVRQNVAFGLEMQKVGAAERNRRVDRVLREIQIEEYADRKPNQLSGGQQQRVALARTLAVTPGCLLLDEPLANLDAKLRRDMRLEIRRLCKENRLTGIYVTHDRAEALSMADRLAVMRGGRIVQTGTPQEVYRRPADSFVAGFIGETNLRDGVILERLGGDEAIVDCGAFRLHSAVCPARFRPGDRIELSMRPEAFRPAAAGAAQENILEVTLRRLDYLGEIADYIGAAVDGTELKYYTLNPDGSIQPGQQVRLTISPDDVVCL